MISIALLRTPEQFAAFHAIQADYETTLPEDLGHELPAADLLPGFYAEPNAAFIGFVGDAPAGSIAAVALNDATDELRRLYVRPAFRSAGLARALVTAVIERARKRRRMRIVLDTDRDRMATAYGLYRSFGFAECAPFGAVRPGCPTYMELALDR